MDSLDEEREMMRSQRYKRGQRLAYKVHAITAVIVAVVGAGGVLIGLPGIAVSIAVWVAAWATWRWVTKPIFQRKLDAIYEEPEQ